MPRDLTPKQLALKAVGQAAPISFGEYPEAYALIFGHVPRAQALAAAGLEDDPRLLVEHEHWRWSPLKRCPETGDATETGLYLPCTKEGRGSWPATLVRPAQGHDRQGLDRFRAAQAQ